MCRLFVRANAVHNNAKTQSKWIFLLPIIIFMQNEKRKTKKIWKAGKKCITMKFRFTREWYIQWRKKKLYIYAHFRTILYISVLSVHFCYLRDFCTDLYRNVRKCTEIYGNVLNYTLMYRNVQECTIMYENINKYKSKLINNNIL